MFSADIRSKDTELSELKHKELKKDFKHRVTKDTELSELKHKELKKEISTIQQ